jgi:Lon protease-like protein
MIKSFFSAVADSILPQPEVAASMPIFPLGSVLFPGGTLALKIFERRYMDMATACLKSGSMFGIALIRSGAEVGASAVPEPIGTVARIADWDMQDLGILQIRVYGEARFRLVDHAITDSGLIVGEVTPIAGDAHEDCPEFAPCVQFLHKVYARTSAGAIDIGRFEDAAWVSFRITEMLPLGNAVKQKMLELTSARMRLEILHRILSEQRLIA